MSFRWSQRLAGLVFFNSTETRPSQIIQHFYDFTAEFGVSVPTCVRIRRSFREGGLQALAPLRRGPRRAHKVSDEILDFIAAYRSEHGPVGTRRLAPVIEERFGVSLHPRTINKAIERSKKNTAPRYGRAR